MIDDIKQRCSSRLFFMDKLKYDFYKSKRKKILYFDLFSVLIKRSFRSTQINKQIIKDEKF
ncbi:hypothetical protein BpHYR1_012537 [Brachionus plicatilis]|uniref:Uncharacterized protein n=1 Tax=Brachionus plicatilis TaxID=10195 RepID=A0A3M7SCK6_BRAPC|nr:hypothetical protein BpHYR1_012537 [Brachionus plicatilis]